MIIKFFQKLFSKREFQKDSQKENKTRENLIEPDFIDYDGMGNQGRFPKSSKNN